MAKEIPISKGTFALVSDEDFDRLKPYKWCLHVHRITGRKEAQRALWTDGKLRMVTMHETIMGVRAGFEIDHRNRNGLDNQRGNLRWATRSQNMANRGCWNRFGVKGVFRNGGKFSVRVTWLGKRIYVGVFTSLRDAADAYDEKARELHGEFAVLNNYGKEDYAMESTSTG